MGSAFLKAAQLLAPLSKESFDVKFALPVASSWSYHAKLDGSSVFGGDVKALTADDSVVQDPGSVHSSLIKDKDVLCTYTALDGQDDKSSIIVISPVDALSASIVAEAAATAANAIDDYTFMVKDFYPSHSHSQGFNAQTQRVSSFSHSTSTSTPSDEEKNYSHLDECRDRECSSTFSFQEKILPPDGTGTVVLRVVFDGVNRAVSDFKIKLTPQVEAKEHSTDMINLDSLKDSIDVKCENADGLIDEVGEVDEWIERHLIGVEKLDRDRDLDSKISVFKSDKLEKYSHVELDSYTVLDDSHAVLLGDKVIRPNVEDDIICRMIHVDQLSYKAIMEAAGVRIKSIMQSDIQQRIEEKAVVKAQWGEIEALYLRQRIWRKVATTTAKGMREHTADFNKSVAESVPASWAIRVDGRPAVKEEEEEVKEGEEDAVCMCCFDGSSLEGNRIMFCDGCNAAVHQACYGVQEIPEGDFFCDRCRAVQVMADTKEEGDESEEAFDPDKVRDVIKCCMCPLYHGGFKPTTDGRWIHMCCALWSGESTILDINEMAPINVSAVKVQECRELEPDSFDPDLDVSPTVAENDIPVVRGDLPVVPAEDACMYCGAHGGYVVRCGGSCADSDPLGRDSIGGMEEEKKGECGAVFHPLCAWFQGVYLQTKITDPTFQGHNREGLYPSGLTYLFLCHKHCPEASRGAVREQQIALRRKYQINVDDLDQIPGKSRSKRKKKRAVPVPRESAHSRSALGSGPSKIKDLNRDVYDIRICAICLSPMECAFPHSLFKPVSLPSSSPPLQLLNSPSADTEGNPSGDSPSCPPVTAPVPTPASTPLPNPAYAPVPPSAPILMHSLSSPGQITTPQLDGASYNTSFPEPTIIPFSQSNYPLLGNTLPSLIHQASNGQSSLQPFSQIFPNALLPSASAHTAAGPQSLNTYSYPDTFILPAFPYSPPEQTLDSHTALGAPELSSMSAGSDGVKAALDALFSCDLPPSAPPPAAFFHRLTCSECGINVHLGCHYEIGGKGVLGSDAMKGILCDVM